MKECRDRLEGAAWTTRRRSPLPSDAGGTDEAPGEHVVDPPGAETGTERGVGAENRGDTPGDDGGSPGGGEGTLGGDNASPAADPDPADDKPGAPAGAGRKSTRGGLDMGYDHHGAEDDRSFWDEDKQRIVINLDHPVVSAVKALPDDEATFRRLSFEIAFTTYAIALADLQFEREPALSGSAATYKIRNALERVWASAGSLYAV